MECSNHTLDHDAIERGRPFNWIEGCVLHIAKAGCAANRASYRRRLERAAELSEADRSKQDQRSMDDEVFAESILLGWSGITKDGAALPYSYENSLWLIQNISGLREFVVEASRADALFTMRAVEAAKQALKKS